MEGQIITVGRECCMKQATLIALAPDGEGWCCNVEDQCPHITGRYNGVGNNTAYLSSEGEWYFRYIKPWAQPPAAIGDGSEFDVTCCGHRVRVVGDAIDEIRWYCFHHDQCNHTTNTFRARYPEAPAGANNIVLVIPEGAALTYSQL